MIQSTDSQQKSHSGFYYFVQGWRLVTRPGIKRFVILPLLANIILLGGAFWWLYTKLGGWIDQVMSYIPSWLQWLDYLIWPISVISILLIFTYFFSTVANIIAAPFNGWLSEKLESELTGVPAPDGGIVDIAKDVPRMVKREFVRIGYYLPRAIGLLILFFIPGIGQTVAPILWFLFGAWMMSIQYCDYPFDNHRVSFSEMKNALAKDRMNNIQFGGAVSVLMMIPILNLIIMPVAVCGATLMWVDQYRARHARY
ncbi:TPA: sulfate transporter CysZ [Providencia stuartii]|uniref:Sulfate transporter CysZ n=3 Tax=Providencia stuartii TaxID=588 RepID=A0AAJ1N3S4_PROST|nr:MULTISPECIES: sulfate transporter CysZ [Providencia]SST00055.1 putative sulfate transport protein CysZ [Acinetobacter baumannii]AFH92456.1 putative sulfate transport protein CysZ [Providencia stuartii MRSN 2154]AIN64887.1 protein CysZ [Providencia stuartii]AMG65346.1 sulfate transporter CysZ [Providencia stuartii]APG50554.1 sulfate transporter CysZ [Providencia stuartii]